MRIEEGEAYANLVLGPLLERSGLDARDRGLATELVYGTTRMRRACDWLVDRFVTGSKPLDVPTRAALRLGAYQLVFLAQPPHAAVGTAVDVAPNRSRGLVNAVLRKVAADHAEHGRRFPDEATALSYPDWIVERLRTDLGAERASGALAAMSEASAPTVRDDGYTQDRASQWVAAAGGGGAGGAGARPLRRPRRQGHRPGRVGRLGGGGRRPARPGPPRRRQRAPGPTPPPGSPRWSPTAPAPRSAPRRSTGSWSTPRARASASSTAGPTPAGASTPTSVERLAALQVDLVLAAADLVRPGGLLVVSVCTLTAAETTGVDEVVAARRPDLAPLPPPADPWVPWGRGALLLPQAAGHRRHGPPPLPGPRLRGRVWQGGAMLDAKVLTVSDGVVDGVREDRSGAALADRLAEAGFDVVDRLVTPDGAGEVAAALRSATAGFTGLVVTTGGTGFGPRDLTPEGTALVLERQAPGLAEAMRLVNPLGRLSRGVAGTVGQALVLNTPGSTAGSVECLEAVLDVVPHALDLMAGGRPH